VYAPRVIEGTQHAPLSDLNIQGRRRHHIDNNRRILEEEEDKNTVEY